MHLKSSWTRIKSIFAVAVVVGTVGAVDQLRRLRHDQRPTPRPIRTSTRSTIRPTSHTRRSTGRTTGTTEPLRRLRSPDADGCGNGRRDGDDDGRRGLHGRGRQHRRDGRQRRRWRRRQHGHDGRCGHHGERRDPRAGAGRVRSAPARSRCHRRPDRAPARTGRRAPGSPSSSTPARRPAARCSTA